MEKVQWMVVLLLFLPTVLGGCSDSFWEQLGHASPSISNESISADGSRIAMKVDYHFPNTFSMRVSGWLRLAGISDAVKHVATIDMVQDGGALGSYVFKVVSVDGLDFPAKPLPAHAMIFYEFDEVGHYTVANDNGDGVDKFDEETDSTWEYVDGSLRKVSERSMQR